MLAGFGSALGGIANTVSNIINYKEQQKQKEFNNKLALDQFNYQKQLNSEQMDMQKNAVSIRQQDLINSGINPLIASGQSADAGGMSGSAVRGNEEAAQLQNNFDLSSQIISAMQGAQQIKKTKAETQLDEMQTLTEFYKHKEIQMNNWLKQLQGAKTKEEENLIKAQIKKIDKEYEAIKHNLEYSQQMGLRTTDSINTTLSTGLGIINNVARSLDNIGVNKAYEKNAKKIKEDNEKDEKDWEYIGKNEGGGRMYRSKSTGRIRYE